MEPQTIEPDYWGVLVQWVVFFGFLGILIVPAFLYMELARKFDKKKWMYFILGLIVGAVGLIVVNLFGRTVRQFTSLDSSEVTRYVWLLVFYLLGYLFVWSSYRILLTYFIKQKS